MRYRLRACICFPAFCSAGEEIYEVTELGDGERRDMNPSVPWYTTGAGTKTYMVGTLSDETIEQTVDNEIRAQYAGMEKRRQKTAFCLPFSGETAWTRQRFSV